MSKREEPKRMLVQVTGQPPLEAGPAAFANFLGISRIGNQVQFEFIYVDLNVLAQTVRTATTSDPNAQVVPALTGTTVSKVVIPAESLVQTEAAFHKMFDEIKEELNKYKRGEESDERKRANS